MTFWTALALAVAAQASAPTPTLESLTNEARAARTAGDYPGYMRAVEGLERLLPWSPTIRYSRVRALALNGRKAEAVATLRELAEAGWGFDAQGDEVLAPIKAEPGFADVAALLARNAAPQGRAQLWRKLPLAGRQPEGVAAAPDGALYVGALKDGVYRVEANGLAKLYTPEAGWGVVGLRVDAPRSELLACLADEAAGKGRLVRLALPDGAERARVDLPASRAFCNDSAVLPDGRVALTDSIGGRLWLADRSAATEVKTDQPLVYPNGVAWHAGRLFVAHAGGLRTIDLASSRSRDVTAAGTGLMGIDGLISHGGALYAVQNGTAPIRVLRITPGAGNEATVEVLASGYPVLTGATTVAAQGERLLVLSQTGIPNGSQPDDPVLAEVPLG
jgi:hypothetical protein